MKDYLQSWLRQNETFKINAVNDVNINNGTTKIEVKRQGEGTIGNLYSLNGSSYIVDQSVLTVYLDGNFYVLGYSPYASSKDIVEIT